MDITDKDQKLKKLECMNIFFLTTIDTLITDKSLFL